LGRTSFRTIKINRDYLGHRKSASWLYLSRLASLKEYSYMKALFESGFPVPRPIEYNRHAVLMELIPGTILNNIKDLAHPGKVYRQLMDIITKFAQHGLIHCDFNEFNIMVKEDESIVVIDFPQMVSIDHINAEMYFNRDVDCIRIFFERRFSYIGKRWPSLTKDIIRTHSLDKQVAASGFTKELEKELDRLTKEQEVENPKQNEENQEISQETEEPIFNDEKDNEKDEFKNSSQSSSEENEENLEENPDISPQLEPKNEPVEKNQPQPLSNPSESESDPKKPGSVLEGKHPKERKQTLGNDSSDNSSNEAEEKDQNDKEKLKEMKQRQIIQRRVRKQLAQKQKRQKNIKNTYKQRDKRAAKEESDAWINAY